MIYTITEVQHSKDDNHKKNAGGKAREDLHAIFMGEGASELAVNGPLPAREDAKSIRKLLYHFEVARKWDEKLSKLSTGDVLLLQFPVINHTLFLGNSIREAKKRGVKICAFIHDLEVLRMSNDGSKSIINRWRLKKEETDALKEFDYIVAHNNKMKDYMINKLGVYPEKIIVLGIFDYLLPVDFSPIEVLDGYKNCIIAGNLMRKKAGYIYNLPDSPIFELYGLNFEDEGKQNIHYHGSFLPDELVDNLEGGFGLVWDGDSEETCSGTWGEYLRYNNPHKTSLYLACGIPVIIWEEAALAEFVVKNDVGITIASLYDIAGELDKMSEERYSQIKSNTVKLSKSLRNGENTKSALSAIGVI